jgi:competence protein ComEA
MNELLSKIEEYKILLHQYKVPLFFGIISIICICISLYIFIQNNTYKTEIDIKIGESSQSATLKKLIIVDISGGVEHPGVYEVMEGSRISDVITIAGGLSSDADNILIEKSINRASRVLDGTKIYIPITSHNNEEDNNEVLNTSHNKDIVVKGDSIISINSASNEELESLPGVGPSTASKIIDNRPYMNLDELITKKAVGKKLFEQIHTRISL